jgi:acyl-homoserine-lactone acylase
MRNLALALILPLFGYSQFTEPEIKLFKAESQRVTIIRDDWGVPHIYGRTDGDAVFGLMYAQCEENFQKVEENTVELLGRMAEMKGSNFLYQDLQIKLIYDTAAAMQDYKTAPPWFKKLLDAYADGINYYLYSHPEVKPAVLNRFQPWYALMRTNGSISATQTGGIITQDMKNLYKIDSNAVSFNENQIPIFETDQTGSNGFAVAPSKTKSKNAIIYINPHVTFYYRSEMQMASDEGLNAYGGVTWGTFFIFQGFNEHCGWMHTTSAADVADLYEEKVQKEKNNYNYRYNGIDYPIKTKKIRLRYKQNDGFNEIDLTGYYTNHGPVMAARNGKWLSLKENNRSLTALMQSWLRTKSNGFDAFKKIMDLRSNSSDNTVFADDKGNIAYWHGNFIPKRDSSFDFSKPVDGTITATDWKGIHTLDEMVHLYNPSTGWIENCNSTPFTVSGSSSPKRENYPAYMAPDPENYRAINAERLLDKAKDLTIDKLIKEIGYSHYLSAFEVSLPPLFTAYDELTENDSLKNKLAGPISLLRSWDKNSSDSSVATTIAIEWASRTSNNSSASEKLVSLAAIIKDIEKRFGSWKTPWGNVNRYQRINDGEKFDDSKPSLPVGLASSQWGSIPSFAGRRSMDTNKRYGYNGNSFIACVEFGKRVKAKSIITGGQSFDPSSKHFTDQAQMYIDGNFKDVLFYKEDVLKHVERKYHPGE